MIGVSTNERVVSANPIAIASLSVLIEKLLMYSKNRISASFGDVPDEAWSEMLTTHIAIVKRVIVVATSLLYFDLSALPIVTPRVMPNIEQTIVMTFR